MHHVQEFDVTRYPITPIQRGKPRKMLYVSFLRKGRVVKQSVLEERYAMHTMGDWRARGPEYRVRNHPVKPAVGGVRAAAARHRIVAGWDSDEEGRFDRV